MSYGVRGRGLSEEDVALLQALASAIEARSAVASATAVMRIAYDSADIQEHPNLAEWASKDATEATVVFDALRAEAKRRGLIGKAER